MTGEFIWLPFDSIHMHYNRSTPAPIATLTRAERAPQYASLATEHSLKTTEVWVLMGPTCRYSPIDPRLLTLT